MESPRRIDIDNVDNSFNSTLETRTTRYIKETGELFSLETFYFF